MVPHLYHLTVQKPSVVEAATIASFSPGEQSLVIARGSWLEIWEADPNAGKLVQRSSVNVFSYVRNVKPFRLGDDFDRLLVSSDSGTLALLRYDPRTRQFSQVQSEAYGRSGVRRSIPGEYLAVDAHGRAVLVASIERSRLVYVISRDESDVGGEVQLSSPIAAHAPQVFCYGLVSLDVGFSNPTFASLERTAGSTSKEVVFYEFNLSLNIVLKKGSCAVPSSADLLMALPGGRSGPSGVIIGCDSRVIYLRDDHRSEYDLPRSVSGEKESISCGAVHAGTSNSWFVLLQTSGGSTFRLNFSDSLEIRIQYFGRLVTSTHMAIFDNGFLWCAAEHGSHTLYQFVKLDELTPGTTEFDPATDPENVLAVDVAPLSIAPLTCSTLQRRQLIIGCGRGLDAGIAKLEHQLEIEELALSELPDRPSRVNTWKRCFDDHHDSFIALTFAKKTLVLSVSEDGVVTEVVDPPISAELSTIAVYQVGMKATVQIHPGGLRHSSNSGKVTDWCPAESATVLSAAGNNRQVLISLSSNELVYFEVDENDIDGMLVEYQQPLRLPGTPTSVALGSLSAGVTRSLYAAVATEDLAVRIFSLHRSASLKVTSIQIVPEKPVSISLTGSNLTVGLENGMMVSSIINGNKIVGGSQLTRILGSKPVYLKAVRSIEDDKLCVIAMSSSTWLTADQKSVIPLSAPALVDAETFSTADADHGIVAVYGQSLLMFSVERAREPICKAATLSSGLTPLRIARNSFSSFFYTACMTYSRSEAAVVVSQPGVGAPSQITPFSGPVTAAVNVRFDACESQEFLAVSNTKSICVFEYVGSPLGSQVVLVHSTPIDGCHALVGFRGKLLVGAKNALVLLDLGQKQLLRKAHHRIETALDIRALAVSRNIVYIGDMRHSVTVVGYDGENFVTLACDPTPRSITALQVLDTETVAAGDKFGSVSLLRVSDYTASLMNDPDGLAVLASRSRADRVVAAPECLKTVTQFYVHDAVTSLHKGSLGKIGGFDALIYTGVQGTIGIFVPLLAKHDLKILKALFDALSQEPSLVGRMPHLYRSYYAPSEGVIDGDLCEQFFQRNDTSKIAPDLDLSACEIEQLLIELRSRCAF